MRSDVFHNSCKVTCGESGQGVISPSCRVRGGVCNGVIIHSCTSKRRSGNESPFILDPRLRSGVSGCGINHSGRVGDRVSSGVISGSCRVKLEVSGNLISHSCKVRVGVRDGIISPSYS